MINKDKPNVSICIPTYKRAELLRRTLESIIDADLTPFEVIIGDNGGGDAQTEIVVKEYITKLPIRHIIHTPPLNYGGNLQAILSVTQGDWIGVIHDDDFYLPGCGSKLRSAISSFNFDFFFSDHLICSNSGEIMDYESAQNSKHYNRTQLVRGEIEDTLAVVLRTQACMDGWFAKKELLNNFNPDLRWIEFLDTQYLIHFAINSNKWFYESTPTFVYRINAISLTSSGLKVQELYEYYSNLELMDKTHIKLRDQLLFKYAPIAVSRWLKTGNKLKAMACLKSKNYPNPTTLQSLIRYVAQLIWVHLLTDIKPNVK